MTYCVPAPKPEAERRNLFRFLAILKDNPLKAWTAEHFERPFVRDRLPFMSAIIVSDPAAIQRVLLENATNYRKDDLLVRILSPTLTNGLLTVDGEQWRRQRRAVAPTFARRAITGYAREMKNAGDALVRRLRQNSDGSVVDMAQEATDTTLDVLQRTIFSRGLGSSTQHYREQMRRYFDAVGRIDPFDILGLPTFIPRWTKWRARPAIRFFDAAVRRVVLERQWMLAEEPHNCPQDILTLLLEARDPETGKGLSEEELHANVITLIAAGHETTANAVTWSLFLLSRDAEWQELIADEARLALADAPERTAERLVCTRAVIEEALRLYPPIAAISRVAMAADELSGERISAGTLVIISPFIVHRHRLLWKNPDSFDPGRFLGTNRQYVHRYAYLPFGAGPRICLGAAFALQEAAILLASVVVNFKLKAVDGFEPEPLLRITLRPRGGLPMVLAPRHDQPLRLFGEQSIPPRLVAS